jgi:hypothetical protein
MATRLDELTRFLRESLARGIPRTDIERALIEAGWHPERVKKALAGFADVAFPLPVPRPVHHLSAGEAFLYLVLFAALGTAAYSVAEVAFNLIEFVFYDPAASPVVNMYWWLASVRGAVARVLIAFPVFLFAAWWTARTLARDPAERASPIRRWLTYLAMFAAVCVIIGDFVTLIAYMLAGETTLRFLLKVAVVAAIAGAILGYYLYDLREGEHARRPIVARSLLTVSVATALAAIGGGLWLVGPPAEQAARRIDDRRVQELRAVGGAVDIYFERNARLPESLQELTAALQSSLATTDPETGARYDYRTLDARSYELCATFARPSESVATDAGWTHGEGRQCFTLKIKEKGQTSSP